MTRTSRHWHLCAKSIGAIVLAVALAASAFADPPDADGDSVPDASDCAPTTPGIGALPGEVGNTLTVTKNAEGSSTAVVHWRRGLQAPDSAVYRGEIAPGSPWTSPTCLLESAVLQLTDADIPSEGHALYYLVSGVNVCGESLAGHRSDGTPIVPAPACPPSIQDTDGDGVRDLSDNCVLAANAPQSDPDHDFVGSACDLCPGVADPAQADADGDGIGDSCDPNQVVINEVLYDGGAFDDFVELFVAQGAVDLTGWTLSDGDEETFTFSSADPRFPCQTPFVLQGDEHVVLWQGSGVSVCSGPVRHVYLAHPAFLDDGGDDLTLRDSGGSCRDFVAVDAGPEVGQIPADCAFTGTAPSNGDAAGTSVSRFDGLPFIDTDSGGDWEASGSSTTQAPRSPGQANESSADVDGDGVLDHADNCVSVFNPTQEDADGDGPGDACDACPLDPQNDVDGDGVCGNVDNCPTVANPSQGNADGDAQGDACDPCPLDPENDVDGDGVCGNVDNCPGVANPSQGNADGDAQGDACDTCPLDAQNDVDGDAVCGNLDNCPTVPNPGQADSDHDGIGDACEPVPTTVTIKILEQDIRADQPTWAQHRQQPTTRLGFHNSGKYRSLGRIDLSVIPPGAIIDDVLLVYWTTSGDPGEVPANNNGDVPNEGATITVELRKMLKAWNYNEPFTYPVSYSDNDTPATTGQTSWNNSLFPATWEVAGAVGATDSVLVATVGTVSNPIDTRFDFSAPALVPLVQGWLDAPATNHGYLLKAPNSQEFGPVNNRKILCGKGFPLETTTNLDPATAISHRPEARITYHLP